MGNLEVIHPHAHLHAPLGVAGEEVTGGNVDTAGFGIAKAVDAGVLQIPSHQAADVNVFGFAGHACAHAANAPHDHIHPHPGTAGLADLGNDLRVIDGVVFQNHGSGFSLPGQLDLFVHFGQQHRFEPQRRHQHGVRFGGQALYRHVVEHGAGLLANVLPGGDKGKVGVQLAGLFVIVTGADLGNVAVFAAHPAGDEGQLGMDLVVVKTVEHGTARVLQLLGPVNVVLLVKAGAQLHHGHHFLAVLSGSNEGLHDLGVGCHAVQRHFDGYHVRIRAGTQQHPDKGADALVGIGQQHIMAAGLLI